MTNAAYDPLDTVRWMLDEARRELLLDTYLTDEGKARKKTKAMRNDDRVRFDTLCTVLWNVSGRSEPLEHLGQRRREVGAVVVALAHDVIVVAEGLDEQRVGLDVVELDQLGLVGGPLRVPADLHLAVQDLGLGQRDGVARGELTGRGRRGRLGAQLRGVGGQPERDLACPLRDGVDQRVPRSIHVLERLVQATSVQHSTSPAVHGKQRRDRTY